MVNVKTLGFISVGNIDDNELRLAAGFGFERSHSVESNYIYNDHAESG